MTLSELANYIATKLSQTDAASVAACKMFLRARYRMLWDSANWPEALALTHLATTPSVFQVMAAEIETVIRVFDYTDNTPLEAIDPAQLFDFNPSEWTGSGATPIHFVIGPNVAIPVTAEGSAYAIPGFQVSATNSEAFDVVVRIAGVQLAGGAPSPVSEVLAIPAGGSTASVNYYDKVFSLGVVSPDPSAPLQSGIVAYARVGGATVGPGPAQILPGARDADAFCTIRLLAAPAGAPTLLVLGKRRRNDLLNDGDAPIVRGCDNALIAFAQADMLERDRQYAKAQAKLADGNNELQLLANLKRQQAASQTRIIPADIHGALLTSGFTDKTHW